MKLNIITFFVLLFLADLSSADDSVCCQAEIASCLACKEGITIKHFCKKNPKTDGCACPDGYRIWFDGFNRCKCSKKNKGKIKWCKPTKRGKCSKSTGGKCWKKFDEPSGETGDDCGAMTPPPSETYKDSGGGVGAMTPPPSETYPEAGGGGGAMTPPPSETYNDGFIDYRTLAPTALGVGAMTPPPSETYPETGGGGGAM